MKLERWEWECWLCPAYTAVAMRPEVLFEHVEEHVSYAHAGRKVGTHK
jgi:hypothetical protein